MLSVNDINKVMELLSKLSDVDLAWLMGYLGIMPDIEAVKRKFVYFLPKSQ